MDKPKILFVDDEHINLMLFSANLEDRFNILTAKNGIQGLEKINENPDIQIVISDMKMPFMNGIEFVKKAKEIFPKISFYILSGFEICDEINDAINNELICNYYQKPFCFDKIATEIETALIKN